jgi:GWxTD domain-containing protein
MRLFALLFIFVSLVIARPGPLFKPEKAGVDCRLVQGIRLEESQGELQLKRLFTFSYDAASLTFLRENDSTFFADVSVDLQTFRGRGKKRRTLVSRHELESFLVSAPPAESDMRWFQFVLPAKAGKTDWQLRFEELGTHREHLLEGRFKQPDVEGLSWFVGSLFLLAEMDSLQKDPLNGVPLPVVQQEDLSSLLVAYEVWSENSDSLYLTTRILNPRGHEHHERTVKRFYEKGITHNTLELPLEDLPAGDYTVEIRLGEAAEAPWFQVRKKPSEVRRRRFTRRWKHRPNNVTDLDRAVQQLRYLMTSKAHRRMMDQALPAREAAFRAFWKDLDEDPQSAGNPVMDEYYRRAEAADRRFSWSRFSGWRSDRGRIFMLYGEPDQLEAYDSGLDQKAWQRWTYHEQNRSYLFVDTMGFGDYQLVRDH